MREKRKITSILLLLTLMLVCTACGEQSADNNAGKITEATQEDTVSFGGELTENEDTAKQESDEVAESEEAVVSPGRIQDGIYTNEYAGFACELDSTWEYFSAEELQELQEEPENLAELMDNVELGEIIDQYEQIIDMQAVCANDLSSINVLYQKISMQERLLYKTMSEKQYWELILTQEDILAESYAQDGIIVEEMSVKTVNFLGEERVGLLTKAIMQDINYYIFQLLQLSSDKCCVIITFGSFVEDKTEDMLDLFYAL